MADKKLNALSVVNNAKYVYLEDGNGNQVKMEMSTLASVVGGLQVNNNTITEDLNSYIQTGTYILNGNSIVNLPSDVPTYYGTLFVIGNWMNARQMLMLNNDTYIYMRNYRVNSKSWSSWRKI